MADQNKFVEKLFRNEYGKIIAIMVNKFGPSHMEKIEDAVQDALLKAMQVWGYKGFPDNPTSWLLRVANNSLIDTFRRDKKMVNDGNDRFDDRKIEAHEVLMENIISDSQLKMIFACCHPSLSTDYQIILSLKLMGGFGNKEIAKAMIKKEETVAKSFTRAKKKLKEKVKTLDIPVEMGLQSRLLVVIRVIYLIFSEGYAATEGKTIIKKDICYEAIRLAVLLHENKYCSHPNLEALIALMCFHSSRFDARLDGHKELVDLEHQDRKRYNKELIKLGISYLENSTNKALAPSNYHLEAAVSYYHCIAPSFEATNWKDILHLYNLQLRGQYSPILQLNRIVPFFMVNGAKKALRELQKFENAPHFIDPTLYYAIKAQLLSKLKDTEGAQKAFQSAIDRSQNDLEKRHFTKKMNSLH